MASAANAAQSSIVVPMLDLKAEHEPLAPQLRAAVDRVFETADFVNGAPVDRFESEFAAYCGTAEAVAVSNGTTALHLALRCCDLALGDEVITVSMSFIATAWPILYEGARAVFVDIDPKRFTMDPEALARAITPRTRAIIVVHLYGQCADMDPILEIARARGIAVIEDSAQAAGAVYKGRRAGSMGTFGCFSFYPSKNLGGAGDGGAVTTSSREMAARLRRLRSHAQQERYWSTELGYNYRLDSLQCAILSVKLPHVDGWIAQRRKIAALYDRELSGCGFELPTGQADGTHAYHLYVIKDQDRAGLMKSLQERGIASSVHYPNPIHRQPPFADMARGADLPVTDDVARRCLSLPMYPELSDRQAAHVVAAVRALRR
ncbi:MAG: DegT/DnrJ/EryC1/StrS family aminotransferase [Rhodospirillaceae bacterium]|nr:DegT/DnrJ/EryC1/StrS family aminotransferase [Rhodospirillaceae bacterium]